MGIHSEYLKIAEKEMRFINHKKDCRIYNPCYIQSLTYQILEVTRNSSVLRCCGPMGHLTNSTIAYESVGAHTNLVDTLVTYGLDHVYGWDVASPHYSRRAMADAVKIHDLPENILGDIPNTSLHQKDEAKKNRIENSYWEDYVALCHDDAPSIFVLQLLDEMRNQSSPEGRLLYTADKLSAIIMALCYDRLHHQGEINHPPMAHLTDKEMSPENQAAIEICDFTPAPDHYLLSEIWTVDFLKQRQLNQYDDSGFFTAILIMATLVCHNVKWYSWREIDYTR